MISIVIPVYGQYEMTDECLKAVGQHTQDYEIIVVDNGSPSPYGYAAIRNDSNLGFPVAVNQGIRAAKGDVIVLLNNDCIVTPGWSAKLLKHLEAFSIVGPLTNYCACLQRETVPIYRDQPNLDRVAIGWSLDHAGQSVEVNWVIGFCMMFRRSLFDEIGPFDESLWPSSGEEIDFCLRARKAGHRIGIARDVYVHHEGSVTFSAMQEAGTISYKDVCDKADAHLAERWGKDFWQKQAVTV